MERKEQATRALERLLAGTPASHVEKAVGYSTGTLSKRLSGATATKADDLIAVALSVGKDPIAALIEGGFLPDGDAHPSTVQGIPDSIIFAEAARRAGEITAKSLRENWRDEKIDNGDAGV